MKVTASAFRRVATGIVLALLAGALVSGAAVVATPSTAAPPTTYYDEVIADNPVSYWRFNESSGTTAVDDRGQNTGTWAGGVTLGQPGAIPSDPANKAVSLDGVDDTMSAPNSSSLSMSSAVSVELWVKRSRTGVFQAVAGKPTSGQSRFENYSVWFTASNQLKFYVGDGTTYASATSAAALDTNWHHVVGTFDNAVLRIYVDGVQSGSTTTAVRLTTNANPFIVGRSSSSTSNNYGGLLDELAVYNTVLSPARIQLHYNKAFADLTAPTVTLTAPPAGLLTNNTNVTFGGTAGSAPGDSSTVTVKVYAGSSATGTPAQTLNATRQGDNSYSVGATIGDGQWTAQAEQSDASANTGTSGTRTFTVDTVAPTTQITSQPADPANTATANFGFSANEGGATFACSLDSAPFAACTSPAGYSGLADGSHSFQVRATDAAANTGPPASYGWTVDTVAPPQPAINTHPADPTTDTTASFSFADGESGVAFSCSLDGAGFTACSSPASYSALPDGGHTFQVRAADAAGNTSSPAAFAWTVDSAGPPVPTLDSTPSDPTNSASATFVFSDAEAGVTFACSRDGGAFSGCTSPKTYSGLADGSHTFEVRASDGLGNTSPPASFTWTIDRRAPLTTIESKPPDPSNQTGPTFTFSADEAGATFECDLDGPLDGALFAPCTSPKTYAGLTDGGHTLQVRSTDPAGNTGPVASYSWTVDTSAPSVTIGSKPTNPTESANATFTFSASEAGVAFGCALDGGGVSACTSPKTYTGLANGEHTFQVQATDAAGNTSAAASYTWTIGDATAPLVTLTQPADGSSTTDTTPDVAGVGGTAAGDVATVTVDVWAGTSPSGPPLQSVDAPVNGGGAYAATLPTALAEGTYVARAHQADAAGNVGTSTANVFTVDVVDVTPPVVTLTQPANGSTTTDPTPDLAGVAGTDAGDDTTVTVEIWAGPTPSGPPLQFVTAGVGAGGAYSATVPAPLVVGEYTARTSQADAAGNTGTSSANVFTVTSNDVTPPTVTLTAPANGSSTGDSTPSLAGVGGTAAGDDPTATVEIWAGTTPGGAPLQSVDASAAGGSYSASVPTALADGQYVARARQSDAAGNTGTSSANVFTVDTVAPTTTILSTPPNPSNDQSPTFTFDANESGVAFECELDTGPYSACTSPATFSGLTGGNHVVLVRAVDAAGNTGAAATYSWTIDVVAPTTTIVGKPTNPSNVVDPTFTFSASESGAGFSCSRDGEPFTACTTPQSYSGLGEGGHTFSVRATDAAGNTGPTATYNWTIDTGPPGAPSIDASPGSLSNSASATFAFSSEAGATFSCRVDGAAFSTCTSPKTYNGLADGAHAFEVKAIDAAGNTGPAAGHAWTIDTGAPPQPTISSHPSSLTTQTTAEFAFSDAEGGVSFRCRLDADVFADCVSPKTYAGLADDSHTFRVEAVDAAGNSSTAATFTWTVDATPPPTPTLGTKPADPTNQTNATFTFTDDEANVTFECRLDGAAFFACSSPQSYTGFAEGVHTFDVRAIDAAGNASALRSYGWTIDTTAPAAPSITSAPPAVTNSTAATFEFSSPESGATFSCKLDGGAFASCTSPKTYSGLGAGGHTFEVKVVDAAGNTGLGATSNWTVDTAAPTITLTAPANGGSTSADRPTFSGIAGTASGDGATVTVKVYAGGSPTGTPLQTLTTTAGGGGGSYSVVASSSLSTGTYTARAEQGDHAGNTGLSTANTFTVTDPVILAAGDIADCTSSGDEATAALLSLYPDALVLTLGDNTYPNGAISEFTNCYDPTWGWAKTRTRPALGDHEYGDGTNPNATGYFNYFQAQLAPYGPAASDPTKGWYSYDIGAWHVAVVNADCGTGDGSIVCSQDEQEAWLRADLAASTNVCDLTIIHEPRWSSGSVHGNTAFIQRYWQAAYDHGVDVVLSASDHIYERFAPQDGAGALDTNFGVREFIVGTGGASHYAIGTVKPNSEVRNGDTFGVLKMTLHPTSYDWEFIPEAGRTFTDTGNQSCHASPPPPPPQVPQVRSASSNAGNNLASITITKPAGTVQGDLLVATVAHQSGSNRNMTPPAGWSAIPNTDFFDASNARIHGWYHVAGASEPASYTFTLTGGSGRDTAGGIVAISGANQATPIDASGGQNNGTPPKTTVLAPSITTTVPNTLLIFSGAGGSAASYTPPGNMAEQYDRTTSGTYKVSIEAATQALTSAGATGTRTALASTSLRSVAVMIAIRPA